MRVRRITEYRLMLVEEGGGDLGEEKLRARILIVEFALRHVPRYD